MTTEQMPDPNRLIEAYNLTTGQKAQIPAVWIGDPVLGREWAKTPVQAEYDGDLPPRPTGESTVKEIEKYADKAGIDLSGLSKKDEQLAAIDAVFARHGDAQTTQAGMVQVEVPPAPEGAPVWTDPAEQQSAPDSEPAGQPGEQESTTDPAAPAGNTTQETA